MLDKFFCWLAWMLPSGLAKWAFVRVATFGSTHDLADREMGSITVVEALNSWSNANP